MIELRGGLIVSGEALLLACDLESRGHSLTVKDGQLLISKASELTGEDRAQIRAHRQHLMAIAGYEVPA